MHQYERLAMCGTVRYSKDGTRGALTRSRGTLSHPGQSTVHTGLLHTGILRRRSSLIGREEEHLHLVDPAYLHLVTPKAVVAGATSALSIVLIEVAGQGVQNLLRASE
jgi:hypothetical protein